MGKPNTKDAVLAALDAAISPEPARKEFRMADMASISGIKPYWNGLFLDLTKAMKLVLKGLEFDQSAVAELKRLQAEWVALDEAVKNLFPALQGKGTKQARVSMEGKTIEEIVKAEIPSAKESERLARERLTGLKARRRALGLEAPARAQDHGCYSSPGNC